MPRGLQHGFLFLDPHGDAAEKLLGYVDERARERVIYFDPTRETCPPFNPFAVKMDAAKLTDDLVSAFKMFFGESWGDRLDLLLSRSLSLLIHDSEPHCFADLERLVLEDDYRHAVVARADQDTRRFFESQWDSNMSHSRPALMNRLGRLVRPNSALARVFSRTDNAIDFSRAMRDGQCIIVNLSKGTLGEEPSALLGGFFVAALMQATFARASSAQDERRTFNVYVDEFQNYAIPAFGTLLSEGRKYGVTLFLAHQNFAQIKALKSDVLGNVGTLVAFQVSADDAHILAREMKSERYQTSDGSLCTLTDLKRKRYQDRIDYLARVLEWGRLFPAVEGGEPTEQWLDRFQLEDLRSTVPSLTLPTVDLSDCPLVPFPTVDLFTKMAPFSYLMRVESAANVMWEWVYPAPEGSAEMRAAFLAAQHERFPAPKKQEPPAPVAPPAVPSDFSF